MNPDPTGTDPTGARVTVAEIAEFVRQLRTLSSSLATPSTATDPNHDTSAERAAFAARNAELFARIAATDIAATDIGEGPR